MSDDDEHKIKKELEELKKRNQELEKMIKAVFNRMDKINGSRKEDEKTGDDVSDKIEKKEIEKLLEKDLRRLKKERISNQHHRHHFSPSLEERRFSFHT
ncbi:MAG: hypothetical protein ACTSRR_01170 [Candidatus Heimdallarchaeaceae archaeon]